MHPDCEFRSFTIGGWIYRVAYWGSRAGGDQRELSRYRVAIGLFWPVWGLAVSEVGATAGGGWWHARCSQNRLPRVRLVLKVFRAALILWLARCRRAMARMMGSHGTGVEGLPSSVDVVGVATRCRRGCQNDVAQDSVVFGRQRRKTADSGVEGIRQ